MRFSSTLQKIARHLRWRSNDLLFATGLRRADGLLTRPGSRILLYHGIDRAGRKDLNGRFISATELEQQLRFFRDYGQIVTLKAFFLGDFDPEVFSLALTFDDGYRNNLDIALPLLEKYDAPATIFCTAVREQGFAWLWTDFLDICSRLSDRPICIQGIDYHKKKRGGDYVHPDGRKLRDIARSAPWPFKRAIFAAFEAQGVFEAAGDLRVYWEQLSIAEIGRLAASPLIEVGAHGYWHNNLASLPFEAACEELRHCKIFLESAAGKPVTALAYPDGSYSHPLLDFAQSVGFERQLLVNFHWPADVHDARLRARLTINPYISLENQLLAIRKGHY